MILKIDFLKPFEDILKEIVNSLPKVAGFIGFVILSWLFIKIFLFVVKKILTKTKLDELSKKLSETKIFGDTTINIVLTNVILEVLRWFLILVFLMAGSGIFGLDTISNGIKAFFSYLPKLLTAIAIFAGGVYLGTVIKNSIQKMFKSLELSGGNLVGNIAFYMIVIFLSITALDQAGVDTSIIKSNLVIILGSVLAAMTIAFGLGSKNVIQRLLFGYYSRRNIAIGQKIIIDEIEGTVISIDNICVILLTNDGTKIVLPIEKVVNSIVKIKKE